MKKYLDCYIPTENCNLRCHYCYITQKRKFNGALAHFDYPPEHIRKALSQKRLGGECLINLCAGGETLLSHEVLNVAKALLEEGHYLMIVTNGTPSNRFDEIITWNPELLKRLFFKFSFHFLEFKRLNLFDVFFGNIKKIQKAGCSFTVEITPSDELIPYIDEVKKISMQNIGAWPHITIARDDRTAGIDVLSSLPWNKYKELWSAFNSDLFKFKTSIFHIKRNEFCYAGIWSGYLNLQTGDMRQCYCGKVVDNIYKDISASINFEPIGQKCSIAHCYNGHSFLALGTIPELSAPFYAELRDRTTADGTHWLQPSFLEFFNRKLNQYNAEYSEKQKRCLARIQKKEHRQRLTLKERLAEIKWLRKCYRFLMRKDTK